MEKIKNLYKTESQTIQDAFERVVAEIHIRRQQNGYRSFLFCGCEPGVGNTTMAINLAISMASAGWKTLLIDADLRKKSEYQRLNEDTAVGLSEYLGDSADLKDIIYSTNYDSLCYIGSGNSDSSVVSLLCSNRFKELLAKLSAEYEYIIIDVPSVGTSVDSMVIGSQVDAVVLVTSQGNSEMKYIAEAKEKLTRAGANILGIIVNKVSRSEYKSAMRNFDYFKRQKYKKKTRSKNH